MARRAAARDGPTTAAALGARRGHGPLSSRDRAIYRDDGLRAADGK